MVRVHFQPQRILCWLLLHTWMSASSRMSAAQCTMKSTVLSSVARSAADRPRPGLLMSPPITCTFCSSLVLSRTYSSTSGSKKRSCCTHSNYC